MADSQTLPQRAGRPAKADHIIKTITIGDKSVGKTCCITRYTLNEFSDSNMATLGVASNSKVINRDDKKVKM
tara:strand:- start:567 stop:782 length:216 start_codon:yes stop_codon:yes gene_type:complete